MPTPAIMPARSCPAPAENGPTITVPSAKADSARDRALRLESFSLTPGVLRMTGSSAALVSFEESCALLRELAGVVVSAKRVERAAEALGVEIAEDRKS